MWRFLFLVLTETASMSAVAKKKPKTVPVYTRLPVEVKKAMEDLADSHRRNFSVEVTIALEEYIAKHADELASDEDE